MISKRKSFAPPRVEEKKTVTSVKYTKQLASVYFLP